MKKRLLGGIAALLVAVMGTVLLIMYVQSADKRALANTETSTVFVVQKPVEAGTEAKDLTAAVVKKALPKAAIAADAVTDLDELGSKVTSVGLVPGEQLLGGRMVNPADFLGSSRVAVPEGMQELTLRLPIERVAGGKISAGDTAGIFISLDETSTNATTGAEGTVSSGTQLTFHKVLVTAAQFSDGSASQPEGSSGKATADSSKKTQSDDTYLITIARNSVDAEKIIYAVEFGRVYLSKEPDNATEGNAGVVSNSKVFR
ncbi:Flp pilus assembly protein CpaB [Arthrobacter sp. P2b]|uniref:Flp pilus assembly protein CpaB n=1 Tax=Arthrobacter sp. P2b TaxID=1938741 RepID=UPI0009A60F45|nr:SAF domain-containing protein [Arthrobacter sp. P2b]SLK01464.1 pilus assembly protein CpaB [Arthrobacter sp. P2b]